MNEYDRLKNRQRLTELLSNSVVVVIGVAVLVISSYVTYLLIMALRKYLNS